MEGKKIKVLNLIWRLNVGGIEKVCVDIFENLRSDSFQIDFVLCAEKNKEYFYENYLKDYGCRIYKLTHVDDKKTKKIYLKELDELLKNNKYDVIHAHQDFLNISTLYIARKNKIKIRISHCHTMKSNSQNVWVKFKQLLLKNVCTIGLASSLNNMHFFYGKKNLHDKIYLYRNGIDINRWLKCNLNSKREDYTIVTIGRMAEQKNPFFIVEIMKELQKINPLYKLYWIGEGELKAFVERKIKEVDCKNIQLKGLRTDVDSFFEKAKYCLLPSISEGFGITALEAQAAGVFCFLSDGFPEEVELGLSVRWSLEHSAKWWAEKIDDFIRNRKIEEYHIDELKLSAYDLKKNIEMIRSIYEGKRKND